MDVLDFLAARFENSAAFRSAFPGGLTFGRAEPSSPRPFATVNVLAEVPSWDTEGNYAEGVLVQFTVVAGSAPDVRALRTLLARDPTAGMDRISLAPLGGPDSLITAIRTGGAPVLDPGAGPDAGDVWMGTIDYLFFTYREN